MEARLIKFRGFSNVTNKMMPWDFISKFNNLHKLLTLNHVVVMQFTGLYDKNDTEIYEGDVLDNYTLVTFSKEQACFWAGTVPLCMSNSHREIIGNIHENPELKNQ